MTEFGSPQDGSTAEPVVETAQWTYADEVSGLMDGLFGDLNRDPEVVRNMKSSGLGRATLSRLVKDENKACNIDVTAKAIRMGEALEPTEVNIALDSGLHEDALILFGAFDGGISDLRIRLSTDGSLGITGRLLDDDKKETKRIGFYSSEIGTKPRKILNTMSPQEAMDLTKMVTGRFTEYLKASR